MATTGNHWLVLPNGSSLLHKWEIPNAGGRHLVLRQGSVGFLLTHCALWFDEEIERLDLGIWDEWGHAVRPVRGQTSGYSEHAGGAACDLNSTRHPIGVPVRKTFTNRQIQLIRNRMKFYRGSIEWGGDWRRPDGMHFQVGPGMQRAEANAKRLATSPRGKQILKLNPGQLKIINS